MNNIERDKKTLAGCIELMREFADSVGEELYRNDIDMDFQFYTSYAHIVNRLFTDDSVNGMSIYDKCEELDVDAHDHVVFKARETERYDE